ncbi:MAG: hypothetical protein AABX52_04820 [Nanoarchaeota archaeon]
MEADNDTQQVQQQDTKDVSSLKRKLSELYNKKEELYAKRQAASTKIKTLISGIKHAKSERNMLTDSVKAAKMQRDKLNAQIQQKIGELSKLRKSIPASIHHSDKRTQSLEFLQKQINGLEQKIEHEVMSFEKETQLMKTIKNLKKQCNEQKEISHYWDNVRQLSKEVDMLRKTADEKHSSIQDAASSSQTKHEGVLSVSKEIDELKIQEQELHKQFLATKVEYNTINAQLKTLLEQGFLRTKKKKQVARETASNSVSSKLALRRAEIQAKFKQGKKLTTEDVLCMQSSENIN